MPSVITQHPVDVLSRTVLWSGPPPYDKYGSTVLIDLGPVWIAVYLVSTAQDVIDAGSRIHLRFSINQGLTWSDEDKYYDGSALTNVPFPPGAGRYYGDGYPCQCPNGDILIHIPVGLAPSGAYLGTQQWRSSNGGKAWTDEGLIFGGGTHVFNHDGSMIINGVMYVSAAIFSSNMVFIDSNNFYKSLDNGHTWTFVSYISRRLVDRSTTEAAMEWMGGTSIVAMLRGGNNPHDDSFLRYSNDLGLTWGPLVNFSNLRGGTSFERMRLRRIGSRIYATGRSRPNQAYQLVNCPVFWSDDEGITWSITNSLNAAPFQNAGYGDMLRRGDRTFFYLCYEGTLDAASIIAYVIDIPSHAKELDGWVV